MITKFKVSLDVIEVDKNFCEKISTVNLWLQKTASKWVFIR